MFFNVSLFSMACSQKRGTPGSVVVPSIIRRRMEHTFSSSAFLILASTDWTSLQMYFINSPVIVEFVVDIKKDGTYSIGRDKGQDIRIQGQYVLEELSFISSNPAWSSG